MRQAIEDLFAEHATPTHATTRHVHDGIRPLLAIGAKVQQQFAEYHRRLSEIELSDHDGSIDPLLESIRQTLGAADREAGAFVLHGRELAKAFVQLDRYMPDTKARIAAVLQRAEPAAVPE